MKQGLEVKLAHINDQNSLFRAVADYMEDDEDQHKKYRKQMVHHMQEHKHLYEKGIEDWDQYIEQVS